MGTIMGNGVTIRGGSRANKGVQLNIDYGATPPSDTSKLWIPNIKPNKVYVQSNMSYGDIYDEVTNIAMPSSTIQGLGNNGLKYCNGKFYTFQPTSLNTGTGKLKILYYDTTTDSWIDTNASIPKELTMNTVAVVDNKIYIIGGATINDILTNTTNYISRNIYVYNTEDNTVSTFENKLLNTNSAQCLDSCVLGDKIYCIGGRIKGTAVSSYMYSTHIYEIDVSNDEPVVTDIGMIKLWGNQTLGEDNCAPPMICGIDRTLYILPGSIASNESYGCISWFNLDSKNYGRWAAKAPSGYDYTYSNYLRGVPFGKYIYIIGGGSSTNPNSYNTTSVLTRYYRLDTEAKTFESFSCGDARCYPNNICQVGNDIYYSMYAWGSTVHKFSIASELQENELMIQTTLFNHTFNIINKNDVTCNIGIKSVFLGNSENIAEEIDAYLYDESSQKWKTLYGVEYAG